MGCPNVWGHIDTPSVWQSMLSFCCICTVGIQTSSKHTQGHPNIWECPNIQETSKHRGVQAYREYPNIQGVIQTYWDIQTYRGCIQIYRGIPNIWGCPNIWGHPNIGSAQTHREAFKHRGCAQTYGGIQTYRRVSKHRGHPNIQVGIQTYGGIQTYSGCIRTYGGIQAYGAPKDMGVPIFTGGVQTYGTSKHTGGIQTYGGIPQSRFCHW